MKYPKSLSKLGTVGFVAPSYGCNIEPYKSRLDNAVSRIKEWGHPVMLGPNCYLGEGVGISNTPKLCGKELTDLYCSRDNDVLLSCGGGELMNETMDYVDWERIAAAPPKWFEGYSDNTNFTYLLTTMLDTASIYGSNGPVFGTDPLHESLIDSYRLLRGELSEVSNYEAYEGIGDSLATPENPLAPINAVRPFNPVFFGTDGKQSESFQAEGRLLGGCLDVLANLRGTKYDHTTAFCEKYREDGILWFLENCELGPMQVRRTLWAMKQSGWFQNAAGFLIGRPLGAAEQYGLTQERAFVETLSELRVPIAYGLDFGHLPPMMPMVCGAYGKAEGSGKTFRMRYEFR